MRDAQGRFIRANDNHVPPRASRALINRVLAGAIMWGALIGLLIVGFALWLSIHG